MVWQGNKEGKFTVESGYKEYNSTNNLIGFWPWKIIWKVKVPLEVACFTWLPAKKAALTQDNLCKRGYQLCSRCFLWGGEAETINHLFLHCKWTSQLWRIFTGVRGIQWVMPRGVLKVLDSWSNEGHLANQKERWNVVPACIWWTIWGERNQRCFADKSSSLQQLKMKEVLSSFLLLV